MIPVARKRRFVAPVVLVFSLSLALSYASYETPTVPRVNVRWSEVVTQSQRTALEAIYHLAEPDYREERTWTYAILDVSTENIRRLVQEPAAEDTHRIDRATFELTEPLPPPISVRFLVILSLIGVIVASCFVWMGPERWERLLSSPMVLIVSLRSAWRRWSRAVVDPGSGALAPVVVAPLLGLLACAFLIPLIVHGHIGLSNRYMADDYCLAVVARRGIPEALSYWYASWSGSVFYTLLVSLAGLLPPQMVRFWPAVALTTWAGLLTWTIWQLRPATRRRVSET